MTPAYERDGIRLYVGDCREVVPALPELVSAVVTDPPYGLGFMGKDWDHEVPGEAFWRVFSDAMLPGAHLLSFGGTRTYHRIAVAIEDAGFQIKDTLSWLYGQGFPKHKSLLKPAWEPITLARKPGPGGLNIDACRIEGVGGSIRNGEPSQERRYTEIGGTNFAPLPGPRGGSPAGRWPANVILDEHAAALLDEQAGERKSGAIRAGQPAGRNIGKPGVDREVAYQRPPHQHDIPASAGGASRFFYVAKASRAERNAGLDGMPAKMLRWSAGEQNPGSFQSDGTNKYSQNHHPTVKPLALMRWLLTLVTPPGGIVLDPFVGSGSTLVACAQLGIPAYGIDMNEEYIEIAARRIDHALNERAREEAKPRQLSIAD